MSPIRVMVVDDSLTVRKRLVEILEDQADMVVVGEAATGAQALSLCDRHRPDVITLDMALPDMDGVVVTERLMAEHPTPILIVSASFNRGELLKTCDALAAGALDAYDKTRCEDDRWAGELVRRVRLVARIRVITHPRAARRARFEGTQGAAPILPPRLLPESAISVIVVGASTGGPGALRQLCGALPRTLGVPLLVVLHNAEPFSEAMAEWLAREVGLEVQCARDGEPLPGRGETRVRMAPAGRHLMVAGGCLRLTDDAPRHHCRPSVDVLFESAARELGPAAAGCLLTGMGRDGARGLLCLRQAGAVTFAQDEESSVVWGMPGEAVRLEAACHVLDLSTMAAALATLAGGQNPCAS